MQIEIGRRKKTILSERNISFHELVYTKKGAAHDINLSDPDSGVLVGPTVELQPQKIVKVTLITIHVCIGPAVFRFFFDGTCCPGDSWYFLLSEN